MPRPDDKPPIDLPDEVEIHQPAKPQPLDAPPQGPPLILDCIEKLQSDERKPTN